MAIEIVSSRGESVKLPPVKELKRKRLTTVEHEMARLREDKTTDVHFKAIGGKDAAMIPVGHSLEIRKALRKSHIAFNHGQGARWFPINVLIKKLFQQEHPDAKLSDYKFLRDFSTFDQVKSAQEYNDKFTVDTCLSKELVSVDLYFANTTEKDSAWFYYSENGNVNDEQYFAVRQILEKRGKDEEMIGRIIKRVEAIIKSFSEAEGVFGNVYTICVPKEKFSKFGYIAHSFGKGCPCHQEKEVPELLERLQDGILTEEMKCKKVTNSTPQFRLAAHELTQENGVLIYRSSNSSKEAVRKMKAEIAEVAKEIVSK